MPLAFNISLIAYFFLFLKSFQHQIEFFNKDFDGLFCNHSYAGETNITFVVCDGDFVLFARTLISGTDVHDTVGINVESDLNLGNTSRCRGNSCQLELAEKVVVFGHSSLTLVDLDQHARLVVRVGGEGLCLFGGNGGVSLDE